MAKGRYNISVPGGSNLKERGNNKNEAELENQECMDSCLSSSFLRSLSFHDRPRSTGVPANKELHKSRYNTLVSASLENITTNALPSLDGKSEHSSHHDFGHIGVDTEVEITTRPTTILGASFHTSQHQLSVEDKCLEGKCTRLGIEAEKLLKQTVVVLRTVDKDISESLRNLVKPESIALESVIEIYKNKDKSLSRCSAVFDLSTAISSEPIYENLHPSAHQTSKDVQVRSTPRRLRDFNLLTELSCEPIYENWQPSVHQTQKDGHVSSTPQKLQDSQVHTSRQNSKDLQSQSPPQSPKNIEAHFAQQSPKNLQPYSSKRSPTNLQTQSPQLIPKNVMAQQTPKNSQTLAIRQRTKNRTVQQSPNNLQAHSQQSPKNLQTHSQQSPKNLQTHSQQSPKNLQAHSQQSPKNLQAHSQQSPKNLQAHSQQSPKNLEGLSQESLDNLLTHSQQISKNLLVLSSEQTLKNLQSLLSLDSENTKPSNKPDLDNTSSIEQCSGNVLSSLETSAADNSTEEKSFIEFDLPTDHEQFLKIIGALQNRCLEYREMTQDLAVSVLEECLNSSDLSFSRIRHLRRQFESQKRNFRVFKELCGKSVVFGPDSLQIDEKVTEVIQSFYLKLLQEENETFMARLEFGLKMAEIYARMLKFETESKKIITKLEKEILYLKKTSVGFKV